MILGTVLLVALILALLGVLPSWPHSREWGYAPSSAIGLLAIVLVVVLVAGDI